MSIGAILPRPWYKYLYNKQPGILSLLWRVQVFKVALCGAGPTYNCASTVHSNYLVPPHLILIFSVPVPVPVPASAPPHPPGQGRFKRTHALAHAPRRIPIRAHNTSTTTATYRRLDHPQSPRPFSPTRSTISCDPATIFFDIYMQQLLTDPTFFPKPPTRLAKTNPSTAADHELHAAPGPRAVADDEALHGRATFQNPREHNHHSKIGSSARAPRKRRTSAVLAQLCPRKRRVHQHPQCLTVRRLLAWAVCFQILARCPCSRT